MALADLERRLAHDLDCLGHPPRPWTRPRAAPDGRAVHDVVIVGAGMNGLAAAFALNRHDIADVHHQILPSANTEYTQLAPLPLATFSLSPVPAVTAKPAGL